MSLTVVLLWTLAIALAVMMLAQGLTLKIDLFSVRNIYLTGFIIYQLISPASALQGTRFFDFQIDDIERAGRWLLLYSAIFLLIFLYSYHRLRFADWFAAKLSRGPAVASDSMLTGLALAVTVAALCLRLVAYQVPFLAPPAFWSAIALSSTACAIVGWIWAARRLNPAVILLTLFIIGGSLFITLSGIYSRRPMISVLAGFVWGAYHRWATNHSPKQLVYTAAPLLVAVTLIVAAFTAIRGHHTGETSAQEAIGHMRNADLGRGTSDLLGGQSVGTSVLWVLDSFPQKHSYKPLFSLRYMFYYWIPRAIWEDKPEPFSKEVATLAKLSNVRRDVLTLPPGVIGYAGAEGGFYAVIIYALFFGQFIRFFDSMVRFNPANPYIILPVGCTTGQFLGLARGDIATFTTLAIVGFVSTYLIIYLTALVFGQTRATTLTRHVPQLH